jgi:hypothetical protein
MSHDSVRLSGTGVELEDISGTGSVDRVGRKTPEETGMDINVPRDRASDALLSAVDFGGGVDVRVGGDELSRTSVDDSDAFFLRLRYIMGVGSVAYRRGGCNSVRSSGEGPFPASVEEARPGVVGLGLFEV